MRKEILAVLIVVMVATPCFSQEIQPADIFTLERTLWSDGTGYIGFYRGEVYSCEIRNGTMCTPYLDGNYVDLFWIGLPSFFNLVDVFLVGRGWAIPILGIGRITFEGLAMSPEKYRMRKLLDSWIPSS